MAVGWNYEPIYVAEESPPDAAPGPNPDDVGPISLGWFVAGLGIIAALALRATVAWTQPRNRQPLTDERMSSGSLDLSWACAVLVLAIVHRRDLED